ncbi:hypothetical protein K488DRAFT_47325 [Vararia minispora EC-137]|uniref:Uncharacterized protein n=1 Tax=Vararia minispora EC-137 TaxID=1314806 RepID=A0ACB8QP75_9AGAM|nr:hypothetical protein K488DRAFT_47325 [Vararia minispora EC-137]
MPIPVEPVGSLPRPIALQNAIAALDAGTGTAADLLREQDRAAKDSAEQMQAAGETYATDGEQRKSSFATYPLTDTLAGTGLADGLVADGQYFAIFDDGHHRQLPRLVRGPFRYKTYSWQTLQQSAPYFTGKFKTAVIAPSMLYLLHPLDGEIEGYSREAFVQDLVDECEKDIRGCFTAGAARVSIDFTERFRGRLASKNDPRNPWTARELLQTFIDLNNRVLARFSPEERANIGMHTCPGGDCDSVHSADVPYAALLPSLFQINVGYFLIQLASEKDKNAVYAEIGRHIRRDADGVKQVAFVGVTDPLNPTVETPEQVADALVTAAKYIPVDQLGATDDCGFSPFSVDAKPRHGGDPDFARTVAFAKIRARVEGARIASERLGI